MKNIIRNYDVIGIIGLSKNSGKTTTLNYLLSLFSTEKIGLTSIGLDGESFDQVNFLPKPKIYLKENMVVATASTCLNVDDQYYEVLDDTNIMTALGEVVIVRILKSCQFVIAGPTTNKELGKVMDKMKPYVDKLFVDGAFNRMTFANLSLLDGICLAAGASYHIDMEETIKQTLWIEKAMSLPKTHQDLKLLQKPMTIKTNTQTLYHVEKNITHLSQFHPNSIEWIYIGGAVTHKLVDGIIKRKDTHLTIIADDWTKFLFDHRTSKHLETLNIQLEVIKSSQLLMVTVNPFSPSNHHYEKTLFLKRMKNTLTTPVFNVLEME